MKCKYCGTTIPEGNKGCNGCGKKITIFSNLQTSNTTTNNYKIIQNYNNINQTTEELEQREELLEQTNINKFPIQDKNASLATVLSIIGIMFIPFGFIFNLIALNKAKQISNTMEKEKTLRVVKILLTFSITMTLFTLIPIILSI